MYLHEADLPLYENVVAQGRMFGLDVTAQPPVDRFYAPGDVIRFGRYEVRRPPHARGTARAACACRSGEKASRGADLLVGDTLFAGSIGRTDLPGGDHATLIGSITTTLFAFGDDARVYAGHGEPTTIGRERATNPFLR